MRDKWPPLPSGRARGGNAQTTILVAHEDEEVRDQAVALLQEEGYRVLATDDRDEILRLVGQERLDMILMDMAILHRYGFALQREIRDLCPDLPVVHTSSSQHYRPV